MERSCCSSITKEKKQWVSFAILFSFCCLWCAACLYHGIASLSSLPSPWYFLDNSCSEDGCKHTEFSLLAVRFSFLLKPYEWNRYSRRLVKFSTVLTGISQEACPRFCVLSTFMGESQVSACAWCCMETRILGPAMLERGYSKGYAVR